MFDDPDVVHVDGRVDPAADIETISTELILADLQTLEKAIPRLTRRRGCRRTAAPCWRPRSRPPRSSTAARTLFAAGVDREPLRELTLLTTKPFLYVFNADEGVLSDEARRKELADLVAPADAVFLDAKVESELLELDEESARELLESIGQDEPGLYALARAGFHTLGLQTYLTAGPKESRAWTIPQGATAPQAAGVIHTDFERGLHQGRDRVLRRPDRRRARWPRPRPRARCAWRARTT